MGPPKRSRSYAVNAGSRASSASTRAWRATRHSGEGAAPAAARSAVISAVSSSFQRMFAGVTACRQTYRPLRYAAHSSSPRSGSSRQCPVNHARRRSGPPAASASANRSRGTISAPSDRR
ncbi:hypothetical protein STANM309S_01205 [Streptomyces tanashiensis]